MRVGDTPVLFKMDTGLVKSSSNQANRVKQSRAAGKVTSPNQLQQQVNRKQAPSDVARVDKGNPSLHEKPHVHLKDGRALNQDGTWKHGAGEVSGSVRDWLITNGWMIPR